MKPVQAIFFDLDNTLIDDERSYRETMERVCAELASSLDVRLLPSTYDGIATAYWSKNISGTGDLNAMRLQLWQQTLTVCGWDRPELAAQACEIYIRGRSEIVPLFPDATPVVEALFGRYPLAIITNGASDVQRERLRRTGIGRYFDFVMASADIGVGKPDPVIFRHVLDKLGVEPEGVWHIGDRMESDVAGAKASGLTAVWLNRAGAVRGPVDPVPDHEIATLAELPVLLT